MLYMPAAVWYSHTMNKENGSKSQYVEGQTYTVIDQDGVTRTGVYTGREDGAGVTFDVFRTNDRIPFQAGLVHVFLPVQARLSNFEAKGYTQEPYPQREDYDGAAAYKEAVDTWEFEWEARNSRVTAGTRNGV
jgi:hypothetical protein